MYPLSITAGVHWGLQQVSTKYSTKYYSRYPLGITAGIHWVLQQVSTEYYSRYPLGITAGIHWVLQQVSTEYYSRYPLSIKQYPKNYCMYPLSITSGSHLILLQVSIKYYSRYSLSITAGIHQVIQQLFWVLQQPLTVSCLHTCPPVPQQRYTRIILTCLAWLSFVYFFWKIGDPFPILSPKHGENCNNSGSCHCQ